MRRMCHMTLDTRRRLTTCVDCIVNHLDDISETVVMKLVLFISGEVLAKLRVPSLFFAAHFQATLLILVQMTFLESAIELRYVTG